jgi:hypothetical protein
MDDTKQFTGTIYYGTELKNGAGATFDKLGDWDDFGTLEMCIIWQSAAREIEERTGMDPETFLAGMRELLAPVEES